MNMKNAMRNVLISSSLAAALAACGGPGGGKDTPPAPPTVVTTSQEDKFGVKFGQNFRAPADGEPSPVNDGDLVPVSWTTEPIDIVN
jgi:hypothetical protein